ncbi:hypothetical protein BJ875DRAFT_402625 [Amylocarpus encephaloides]|uniref:Uncharacterized protein n=1 Tax=Amylocarpus encephaloides TaxID=45428 RepID=A0A9P8C4K1_9HELO|nr:hypothetical protein BJ875DRAFT_402625 [Amylocarpus encephaloides]
MASWWLLLARKRLEPLLQDQSDFADRQHTVACIKQVHVDISKALWLLQQNCNSCSDLRRGFEEAETQRSDIYQYQNLAARLSLLVRIRQAMGQLQQLELDRPILNDLEDCDMSICVLYPTLNLDLAYIMTGYHTPSNPLHPRTAMPFPLGDTTELFYFGAMHVDLHLIAGSSKLEHIKYPAILSMVRGREEDHMGIMVGTQNASVDFSITATQDHQPRWKNTKWNTSDLTLQVRFPTGFKLMMGFDGWDFVTLKKKFEHYSKALTPFQPTANETLLYEETLKSAKFNSHEAKDRLFPTQAVADCRLRLYQQTTRKETVTGTRLVYGGLRLVVITPPAFKNLGIISQVFSPEKTVQFGFQPVQDRRTHLSFRIDDSDPKSLLDVTFETPQQQSTLLAHLTGCFTYSHEQLIAQVQLSSCSISLEGGPPSNKLFSDWRWRWQLLRVFGQFSPNESPKSPTQLINSESLRIVVDSQKGRITDRINIGIGELKIRRNVIASGHELHVLRQPQEDLMISSNDLNATDECLGRIQETLHNIRQEASIRTYTFPNLSELHQFQAAITGSEVLFDAIVPSFSISRRRVMIPYHKEWSPEHTRLQLLQRGKTVQLVAFFEGFKHGKCMNFALKGTDVFRRTTRGGGFGLKIVDAKFPLPAGAENATVALDSGFVCLDVLDYPGERDNIYVNFASADHFQLFAAALPAMVKPK